MNTQTCRGLESAMWDEGVLFRLDIFLQNLLQSALKNEGGSARGVVPGAL